MSLKRDYRTATIHNNKSKQKANYEMSKRTISDI